MIGRLSELSGGYLSSDRTYFVNCVVVYLTIVTHTMLTEVYTVYMYMINLIKCFKSSNTCILYDIKLLSISYIVLLVS